MRGDDGISRRRFLALGAAAATLTMTSHHQTSGQSEPGRESIVVARNGSPAELVSGALNALGGTDSFVAPGDFVLVKPNASFHHGPGTGVNTNPEVAAAVVSLCLKAGAKRVVLADHTLDPAVTVSNNGIQAAAEGCGGEFVALKKESQFQTVEIEGGYRLESVDVAGFYLESDVLINLPVLKHHTGTGACVGLKNLMGLVYDRQVFHREGLWETIADLSLAVKPSLTIVDATQVITSNGPRGPAPGGPLDIGKVIAGVDPVAVDVASLEIVSSLGYADFQVAQKNRYITYAEELGLGDGDSDSVRTKTVEWDVSASGGSCVVEPPPEDLPSWVPFGAISAASAGLGMLAMMYDRRRTRDA